jgi:hypothetical protein
MAENDPPRRPAKPGAPAEPLTPGLPDEEKAPPYRTRHDGWTMPRRRRFLHALARTGCVRDACRIAGISNTSAYRMRGRDGAFARAWEEALTEVLPVLEAAAFERAVEGVDEPIVRGGEVIATKKRFSDAILVTLLRRADAARTRAAAMGLELDEEALLAEIDAKLAAMEEPAAEEGAAEEAKPKV